MSNLLRMLYIGASGIQAVEAQTSVVGHNQANINNPDFVRQRVNLQSSSNNSSLYGAYGFGVSISSVTRVYDDLLAKTLRDEFTSMQYWKNSQETLETIVFRFSELKNGVGLGEALKKYFDDWQTLATSAPDGKDDGLTKRTQLLESATQLSREIRDARFFLDSKQIEINRRLQDSVNAINTSAQGIANLNHEITNIEINGKHANDLRDKRDALVKQISEHAGIRVVEQENGGVTVYLGNYPIVDRRDAFVLSTKPGANGQLDVVWNPGNNDPGAVVINDRIRGGLLQSNLELRDKYINTYISQLDELSKTLIFETNKIHSSGQGLLRFTDLSASNAVESPRIPINSVSSGMYPYPVTKGTFQIKVYDPDGKLNTYNIDIDPSTDTLNGIAEKISFSDGDVESGTVQAFVDGDGYLKIVVPNNHTFAFGEDTSGFIIAAGFNNFFTGSDSNDIDVDSHVKSNPNYIAASKTGAPGDNRNALDIVQIKFTGVLRNGTITVEQFYSFYSSSIATDKQRVDIFTSTRIKSYDEYYKRYTNVSGVSEEEVQTDLLLLNSLMRANARYITAVDEMLDTIVNTLGRVGR